MYTVAEHNDTLVYDHDALGCTASKCILIATKKPLVVFREGI